MNQAQDPGGDGSLMGAGGGYENWVTAGWTLEGRQAARAVNNAGKKVRLTAEGQDARVAGQLTPV